MIFDAFSILISAALYTVTAFTAYRIGRRERRRKRVSDGWAGILGYDHSERGSNEHTP